MHWRIDRLISAFTGKQSFHCGICKSDLFTDKLSHTEVSDSNYDENGDFWYYRYRYVCTDCAGDLNWKIGDLSE